MKIDKNARKMNPKDGDGHHEERRKSPLGGVAHPHQRVIPPSLRPATAPKQRRYARVISAGGGVWWRSRIEARLLEGARARKAGARRAKYMRGKKRARRLAAVVHMLAPLYTWSELTMQGGPIEVGR